MATVLDLFLLMGIVHDWLDSWHGGVDLKDQFLHIYMVEWVKKRPTGTSNLSEGYLTLLLAIHLLFIDKRREKKQSSSRIKFS